MAAIRRTPTTILGGNGNGAKPSAIAAIISPPWVFVRSANDNLPCHTGRKAVWASVGIGLLVSVPALLLVIIL
jgi:hypothetical protein